VALAVVLGVGWGVERWWGDAADGQGSSVRTPTPFTAYPGVELHPAVAPDGEFIVLGGTRAGDDRLVRIDATSGRRIAFASTRSGTDQLWRADADGGGLVQLTDLKHTHVGRPRWSTEGDRIAFTADATGPRRIFVVRAEGGPVRPVSFGRGSVSVEDWHRTGLYVASDRSGRWQIWRISPSALPGGRSTSDSTSAQIEQVTTYGGTRAQVDPRGNALFVVRPDTSGLWRVPLQGGPATQVVADPALGSWTPWTVMERSIFYASPRDDQVAVVRLDRRTGVRTRLAERPVVGSSWTVAPDESVLLYTRSPEVQSDLYRIRWSIDEGA
jgi:Tol biopolymer transport system component